MRPIKVALASAIGLTTALLATSSAAATPPDSITGGCYLHVVLDPTSGVYEGVYGDSSATNDSTGTPVAATVTCWVLVNGIELPQTGGSWSGTGAQAGSSTLVYSASATDVIELCQDVAYADGTSAHTCTVQ
jgi:hypothetical protein